MFLVDTNIFLEILLAQEKREICKEFLEVNSGNIYISDFSFHSIGVILFRNKKEDVFLKFLSDMISKVEIITLAKEFYEDLIEIRKKFGLGFDDAYQYDLAKQSNLILVTMDRDFERIKGELEVKFLNSRS